MLDTKVLYMLNFVSSLASYNINLQHKTNFKNKKLRDLLRFQSVDGRHQPSLMLHFISSLASLEYNFTTDFLISKVNMSIKT